MSEKSSSKRVVPDAPQMRSMMVGPQMGMAPPMPMARTFVSKSAPASVSAPKAESQQQAWKIESVEPIPEMYPLERTNVYIPDAKATTVASRIANCFRLESIAADFRGDKAIAETKDHVQFAVRLFASGKHIVVEVQRTSGCSCLFHQAAKAVLRAAKGVAQAVAPRSFPTPQCVVKDSEEKCRIEVEEGLEIASCLLKKDRLDAQMLAMESLVHMSKSSNCRVMAARAIINQFLDVLVPLVESGRMTPVPHDSEEKLSEMEEEHYEIMRRLSLAVLANCFKALEDSGEISLVLDEKKLTSDQFLSILLKDMACSAQKPHDACEAARCLQPLTRSCAQVKQRLRDLGALGAASSACDEGKCRHLLLEQEARLIQAEMDDI